MNHFLSGTYKANTTENRKYDWEYIKDLKNQNKSLFTGYIMLLASQL